MSISSFADFERVRVRIVALLQRHRLEEVLIGVRALPDEVAPFVRAGVVFFAMRHCLPGARLQKRFVPLSWNELAPIADLVTQYLLADPISFDKALEEEFLTANPILMLLRVAGNQFGFAVNPMGQHARARILFDALPALLTNHPAASFDFAAAFRKLSGVSVTDFINVGFMASIISHSNAAFSGTHFRVARAKGLHLPADDVITTVLDQLAADQPGFREAARRGQSEDRRFAMYDFNPLYMYPLLRPWRDKRRPTLDDDRVVAPIPDLVAARISTGVFYQMFNHFGVEFAIYFGYLFEAYAGVVLRAFDLPGMLLSEDDIRACYAAARGKAPDWAVIDRCAAVLIECKATRFSRAALATGMVDAVDHSLKQVVKALHQLSQFQDACRAQQPGLERFSACTTFKPIVVTMEPLHLINSTFFREHIDNMLAQEGIAQMPWLILSVDQLEQLQPHVAAGVSLTDALDACAGSDFGVTLQELNAKTGKVYKDSFLYAEDEALFQQLGVTLTDQIKPAGTPSTRRLGRAKPRS